MPGSDELRQPRRSVLRRRFSGISEKNDGRFVVTTVLYSTRMEVVSPVVTQINVVKIVDLQRQHIYLAFIIPSESSNLGASGTKLE